jgi:hypothetical protein
VDLYEADPSTSSAELTSIVLNLSKNGGSQYINLTLSNAQVIAPIEFDAESGDNEVVNTWIFQPKTYALDVKA